MQKSQRRKLPKLIQLSFKVFANIPTLNSIFSTCSQYDSSTDWDWGSLLVGSFRTNLMLLIFLQIKTSKIAAIFFKWRKTEENDLIQASLQADIVGLAKGLQWHVNYYQLLTPTQSGIQYIEKDACFYTEHAFSTILNITMESMTYDTGKFYYMVTPTSVLKLWKVIKKARYVLSDDCPHFLSPTW